MTRKKLLVIPIIMLVLTTLACSALSSGGATPEPTKVPALFKDDFSSSSSGWSTLAKDKGSGNASVEYDGGEYVMKIFKDKWFVWGNPNESFENAHIEVTVKNTGSATDTSFGIICNYQNDTQQFYYVGIDTQGFYAIAKTVSGQEDLFLTNDNKWATSDAITQNAASYRLGADCGGGTIALYVDGKQIASVTDSDFSKGDVGLFAWTDKQANGEIHFDDLAVTALP